MAKLVEDSRVQTFAADTLVAHDTYLNEIQDQLRGTHKARQLDVMSCFHPESPSPSWYLVEGLVTANTFHWYCTGTTGKLVGHLPLRIGEKITQIDCVLNGGNTGGNIDLYKEQWLTGTGSAQPNAPTKIVADIGGADPWNTGGNYDRVTVSGLAITIDADYKYYFVAIGDGIGTDRIENFSITAQFGN